MSVKGVVEFPEKKHTPIGGGIKFMDDSSSSSSSEESISEALNEAGVKSNGYLSSPAVIGYQRVTYRNEPVYGSIGPTSMPDSDSEIAHYKPSAVIRVNGLKHESKTKRNSLELVDESNSKSNTETEKDQNLTSVKEDKPKHNPRSLDDNTRKQQTLEDFHALLNGNNNFKLPGEIYHQPPKAADRSAAYRLAKRLYYLDGFKTTDVSKHLSKRNDFSQLVGEEFSSFFEFTGKTLDVSLRQFLMRFTLLGETQERERILHHFSKRYLQCNPNSYNSEDSCHTLVCALMLLNTDLHGQHILRRMTVQDFQNNLMNMNGGTDFDSEELKSLYESIKIDPIRWPQPDGSVMGLVSLYCNPQMQACNNGQLNMNNINLMISQQNQNSANSDSNLVNLQNQSSYSNGTNLSNNIPSQFPQNSSTSSHANAQNQIQNGPPNANHHKSSLPNGIWNNIPASLTQPLTSGNEKTRKLFSEAGQSSCLDIPGEINAKEYMRGFLARKWVKDSQGKKPILGKRSWKLYFGRLKDLVLYLYKDVASANQAANIEELYLNQLHAYLQALYVYKHQKNSSQPATQNNVSNRNQTTTTALSDQQFRTNGVNCDNNNNETSTDNDLFDDLNKDEQQTISHETATLTNGHSEKVLLPKSVEDLSKDDASNNSNLMTQSLSTTTTNGENPAKESNLPEEPKPPKWPNIIAPEAVIRIAHAIATKVDDYKKKVNVFKLTTKEGTEYLFQVNDSKELDLWVDKLNFVAALLSAAPMASSISSNGDFHKPLLPSSYTKMNMREQLEDYQRRILELEKELSDYLTVSNFTSTDDEQHLVNGSTFTPDYVTNGTTNANSEPHESRLSRSKSDVNDQRKVKDEKMAKSVKLPSRSQSIKSSLPGNQAGSNTSISSQLSIASSSLSKKSLRRKGSINWPSSQSSQKTAARTAHNERVAYYKNEIHRYRTYARLLESELVRLHHFHMQQQQQAAMLLMRQSYYNLNAGFTPSPQRYTNQNSITSTSIGPSINNLSNGNVASNGPQTKSPSPSIFSNNNNINNHQSKQNNNPSPIAVNPFISTTNNNNNNPNHPDNDNNNSSNKSNNKLLLRKNARQSWRQYNVAFNQMRASQVHRQNHQQQQQQHHQQQQTLHHHVPQQILQQTTHQEEEPTSNQNDDQNSDPCYDDDDDDDDDNEELVTGGPDEQAQSMYEIV